MANLVGSSNDPNVAAVFGEHTAGQAAVIGQSNNGRGVLGISESGQGIWGHSVSSTGVVGVSKTGHGASGESDTSAGVVGVSKEFNAVRGISHASFHGAVVGINDNDSGSAGPGVYGESKGTGVWGQSKTWMGVFGHSESTTGGAGVMGEAVGSGVIGKSQTWMGIYGETQSTTGGAGVWGEHKANGTGTVGKSVGGVGVWGVSETNEGVHAETKSATVAAIAAFNLNPNGLGAAIFAKKEGTQGHAGFFEGNVWVSGELGVGKDIILANADCAEDFNTADAPSIEPGTVMVLGDDESLHRSCHSYDKRVVGVVSGAGNYKPGIVLDKQQAQSNRKPIALLGKVYCKVDASYAPIEVGDMLTTSDTPGHAMRATDLLKAFGAVVGKALRPLREGQGLIPILVALQ